MPPYALDLLFIDILLMGFARLKVIHPYNVIRGKFRHEPRRREIPSCLNVLIGISFNLIVSWLCIQLIYLIETIEDICCGLEVATAQCAGKPSKDFSISIIRFS